ncbi:hypothetical protein DCS_06793 [Drechmeria coniospora]|uniref:Uncharacterized protein n=1 Tax=Drechmeria coniospora TaxID=98403 RepID=A0A151GCJ0_DRECN|nr:hypothetical protein DCS_06793 [Drechmeria coniospora]KYK54832.1 hypothetical protein DCS_06793 [Drechmeria coniospora]ODA75938.1 hypothetical protein RJ55_08579 [Drechmeria coniospora]
MSHAGHARVASAAAVPSPSTTSSTPSGTPSLLPLSIDLVAPRLAGSSNFFPFQDLETLGDGNGYTFSRQILAEAAAGGNQSMRLFEAGCLVDGKPDCPRACGNATSMFDSTETFYNCAALASIAYWSREGGHFYVPAEAERNASRIMAGRTLTTFDERPALSLLVTCAQAACGGDGIRTPCNDSIKGLDAQSKPAQIFAALDTFCPDIAAEINPDIFGPGVLISYLLQVCFSSLLYLFLKAFTVWVSFTQARKEQSPAATLHRRLTRIESMIWPDSSALSRTSVALATTLVEFQEAQCWFVFAIQIASILAIVVNSQEGTFWGEIMVNAAVAFHVSQNGILPMFLIQLCLHNEGIRNWHTFLGFFAEYLLAIVATTQRVYFADAFRLFRKENKVAACGGNPSPRSYCAAMHGVEGLNLGFFPRPLLYKMVFLVLDTVAIVILVLDQLGWTLRNHGRTRHLRIGFYHVGRGPVGRWRPAWIRTKRWLWRTLELAYLVANLLYMVSLVKVFSGNTFEASKWSYGQIIAMTVWGPVIVKLFDLVVSGPPKNGSRLNSGPPRLRIDNVINGRVGTSADEELEDDDFLSDLDRGMANAPARSAGAESGKARGERGLAPTTE